MKPEIEEASEIKSPTVVDNVTVTADHLRSMKVVELRSFAKEYGVPHLASSKWKKREVINNLANAKLTLKPTTAAPTAPVGPDFSTAYDGFTSVHVDGYIYPTIDPTFVVSPETEQLFKAVAHLSKEDDHPPHILMVGPQGCGKTETASQFAARLNLPLLKINCSLVREARDWFGYKTATGGTVSWIKSQFAEAVANGNVVILLDEITRATPAVLNSLLPLLDHTKQSFIEEVKEVLKVGENTFFFATANIGAKFVGTFGRIDSALMDRFAIKIPVKYLTADLEKKLLVSRTGIDPLIAERLVKVANMVRKENELGGKLTETLSTRNLLDASKMFKLIGKSSLDYTIVSLFSDQGGKDSEQSQVLQIIQGQLG